MMFLLGLEPELMEERAVDEWSGDGDDHRQQHQPDDVRPAQGEEFDQHL